MPENINQKQTFSLLEVTKSIQRTLSERYSSAFWVKAEMNKLNHYSYSGHCYPELLEKRDNKVVAQVKSILWKSDYQSINQKFLKVLKEPLKDGIKILFLANITFDPVHGLSLRILDIDPSYTLGDLEQEKQETLLKLHSENRIEKNKRIQIALLPQRIALISVETSKGYADFIKTLNQNQWGYAFFIMLFPSLLQGDGAVAGILHQLKRIEKVHKHFDVVAIIRGGGGDVGLSCFNNYDLAKAIADFPLPILTGIGHATNETVVELISHSNQITPTGTAEFLLQKFHNFSVPIQNATETIREESTWLMEDANNTLNQYYTRFENATNVLLGEERHRLRRVGDGLKQLIALQVQTSKAVIKTLQDDLKKGTTNKLSADKINMDHLWFNLRKDLKNRLLQSLSVLGLMEKNIKNLSPSQILKRGFSITRVNGKAIQYAHSVQPGENMETILYKGTISSTVKSTKEK